MKFLTPEEKQFLDVFLHEATSAPFTGPATNALHRIDIEYSDISHLAGAYEQDVPRTGFAVGRPADEAPPLPWPNRQSALLQNQAIRQVWEQIHKRCEASLDLKTEGALLSREGVQ